MKNTYELYNGLYDVNERKQLICQMLKLMRANKGISQKQLAETIDINPQTYGAYESGRNEPPAEVLVRLSYYYNVPVDTLVQHDNLQKDNLKQMQLVEEYEKQLQELKQGLATADPNTKVQMKEVIDTLDTLSKAIKDSLKENM